MKTRAVLGFAVLTFAAPATAQPALDSFYRSDTPQVLAAPPALPAPEAGAAERFRNSYRARRQPTMVVFWNREFSDKVATDYQDRIRIQDRAAAVGAAAASSSVYRDIYGADASAVRMGGVAASRTIDIQAGQQAVGTAARPGMTELNDWNFEAGFVQALMSSGARLVDRATAMRTTAGDKASGERPNVQAIETGAIAAKADLLIEVLQTPDAAAPVGFSFRVSVKEIKSGLVVATLVSKGEPPKPTTTQYVATTRGFEPASQSVTVEGVGQQLALETMNALSRAWGG